MPEWDFAHLLDDVNLRILRMFEGTLSFDAAQLSFDLVRYEGPVKSSVTNRLP